MNNDEALRLIDELQTQLDKIETKQKEVKVNLMGVEEISNALNDLKDSQERMVESFNKASEALQSLTIESPVVKVPDVSVTVPDIKIPTIVIPEIKVPNVIVPEIKIPKSTPVDLKPVLSLLKQIATQEFVLPSDPKNAIPVRISDGEKFIDALTTAVRSGGTVVTSPYRSAIGNAQAMLNADNEVLVEVTTLPELNIASLPAGLATSDKQDLLLAELQLKADLTDTQPVSATQSGAWNITNISGTVSLPTGAATEATLAGILTTTAFQARINTLGQKTMVNSTPVVLASDQSAISVTQSGTWNISTVTAVTSITNALPAGTNAIGKLAANDGVDIGDTTINNGSGASAVNIQDGGNTITVDGTVTSTLTASSNSTSTAYEASRVAKASSGTLYAITGYNSKSTAQFIQVHNTASLPADASVPVVIFTVPPLSNFSIDFGLRGRAMSTGITVCNSSTGATKTIGASDCWFDIQYA